MQESPFPGSVAAHTWPLVMGQAEVLGAVELPLWHADPAQALWQHWHLGARDIICSRNPPGWFGAHFLLFDRAPVLHCVSSGALVLLLSPKAGHCCEVHGEQKPGTGC